MSCESLEHILDFQYTGQSLFSSQRPWRCMVAPSFLLATRQSSGRAQLPDECSLSTPTTRRPSPATPALHPSLVTSITAGVIERFFLAALFLVFYLFSSLPFPHSLIPVIDRNTLSSARLLTYLCVQWITIRLHLNNCFLLFWALPRSC